MIGAWFDITCATQRPAQQRDVRRHDGQDHYITPNVNFVAGEQCTVTIFKDQVHDQDLDDSGAEHRHAAGELRLVVHRRRPAPRRRIRRACT